MKENSLRLMDFSIDSVQILAKQTRSALEVRVSKGAIFALRKSRLRICVK